MTCRDFAEFIADYASDELPDPIRAAFDQHLRRCPNCREYLALYLTTMEMERVVGLNDDSAAVACGVPEDLVSAILEAHAAMNLND